MIYFDVTRTGRAGHRSGLTRVSARLRASLGDAALEVSWDPGTRHFKGMPLLPALTRDDWLLTSELFSEEERPGFTAFLHGGACRTAAVFHDAIPLKFPHITWPQSVARHPGYVKLLARFDHVWAVSSASREELLGLWQWQGIEQPPTVDVLALGADFNGQPRVTAVSARPGKSLLCVGIIEPRKNQAFLLSVCAQLWAEGWPLDLHLVGRVNPHFGRPILAEIKSMRRAHPQRLHFHEAATDAVLEQLYVTARASVFPTLAEGCGLPLLESLWMGLPCVFSDLPVLRENAEAGGCLPAKPNDLAAWTSALRRIADDDALHERLRTEAISRDLPTWADAAQTISRTLRSRSISS
jgi:glycosyltransferase involved in cell wall biosynthesis